MSQRDGAGGCDHRSFSNFVMAKRAEENRLFERAALRFLSEDDRGTV